ncbi:MAG: hypothetical protein ACFFDN_03665 [Candidatus Hodarchaeota archaeon]
MILGILVMSKGGIPLYRDFWTEQMSPITGSTVLVAGFLNALTNFATQFSWEAQKILFKPVKKTDRENFEILFEEIGDFDIILFLDSFHFRNQLKIKINHIYEKILNKYNPSTSKMDEIDEEDASAIRKILMNYKEKDVIMQKLMDLEEIGEKFIIDYDVRSIFLRTEDGDLLWYNSGGLKKDEIEFLLRKIQTHEEEIVGAEGTRWTMTLDKQGTPAILCEITKSPFLYGFIVDENSALGPISDELSFRLDRILKL